MDDQQTYLLNGLLARQYGLGRVVRFRRVDRGRQAVSFEIFTAQEKEYLVQLYPGAFSAGEGGGGGGLGLEKVARAVNVLDEHRFSVMPFVARKAGGAGMGAGEGPGTVYVGEGPQNTQMLVSLAPMGSMLPAGQYTEHDVSQVGLRLGWMHRLLKEQLGEPAGVTPLAERLKGVLSGGATVVTPDQVERLYSLLLMPAGQGWVHGDVGPEALLWDGDHQLRTVVDWGLLHAGCPLEDVVDAFVQLCTSAPPRRLLEERARSLLESYGTLNPVERTPWTPVVASWCAQRILDAAGARRELPAGFSAILQEPEQLATAIAGCV